MQNKSTLLKNEHILRQGKTEILTVRFNKETNQVVWEFVYETAMGERSNKVRFNPRNKQWSHTVTEVNNYRTSNCMDILEEWLTCKMS